MKTNKRGSVFLVALTCLVILFVLGFSLTFFTGSEDYLSAMSYESEVAFNLAESAVEEFLARLKNSLNHDDHGNQLYKVLRAYDLDVSKEIPLDDAQVAKLTVYTRETARQLYGFQFSNGLVESEDFNVSAVLRLKHINAVEATNGNAVMYTLKKDKKEKQGELEVIAKVRFHGHVAKVTLCFLIRVVKTFFPPFNAFTLYVKDASVFSGSDLNHQKSSGGQQIYNDTKGILRLDNGWKAIKPKFDAYDNIDYWEKALGDAENQIIPPGRVFLGQDPALLMSSGPAITIRSTNGAKLLKPSESSRNGRKISVNGQENLFLKSDVDWIGLKKYFKNIMESQGQHARRKKFLWMQWDQVKLTNDIEVRVINLGADEALYDSSMTLGDGITPCFTNSFLTYQQFSLEMLKAMNKNYTNPRDRNIMKLMKSIDESGLDIFGNARCSPNNPNDPIDTSFISPTLVYGPALRQYYRAVLLRPKDKPENYFELPFIATQSPIISSFCSINKIGPKDTLTSKQAAELFINSGAEPTFVEKRLAPQWDSLPKDIKKLKFYCDFMSDSDTEPYNYGLVNFIQNYKIANKGGSITDEYKGPLKDITEYPLETGAYPYGPEPDSAEFKRFTKSGPMNDLFDGNMWYALPDSMTTYLLDFYFIPRSTEDFFRGRTTVAVGGVAYDRFNYKYINESEHTLELNGILALNDSEPLGLQNLKFRGHGIIYSSPMMGGGKVVIAGDLLGVDTDTNNFDSYVPNNMITIIAPQIYINTDYAPGKVCYVEANLISVTEPLLIKGSKPIVIKGTVATPFLDLQNHIAVPGETVIIYNPLNGIWRNFMPEKTDTLYIAKIVTGGVGKFNWRYERE